MDSLDVHTVNVALGAHSRTEFEVSLYFTIIFYPICLLQRKSVPLAVLLLQMSWLHQRQKQHSCVARLVPRMLVHLIVLALYHNYGTGLRYHSFSCSS